MPTEDIPTSRPGSSQDLARRVERLETEVMSLTASVQRVEINQEHAETLNKVRFEGLGTSIQLIGGKLDAFMARIEGLIDGTIETSQTRQGAALVADYQAWRREVEDDLAVLKSQNVRQSGFNAGMGQTFGTGKAIVVTAAAVVTAAVAVLGALHII